MNQKNTVVLIVDVQNALMEAHPFREEELTDNLKAIIHNARQRSLEVVYVRHDGGEGDELALGTRGWQIFDATAPQEGERIFEKCFNSAFKDTGLGEYLKEKKITEIILGGLQTEYCIDATCKSAFERGFHVWIPAHTTSTFDNDYFTAEQLTEYFEKKMWDGRYADIRPVEEIIEKMKNFPIS